jgi:hypothetical protein
MKDIILEEINRNKLLMNYNSEITLSENISLVESVLLVEQGRNALLKSILGVADETAALALKRVKNAKYIAGVNLFDDIAIYGKTGLKSGDEVMTALIKNTLTKSQLSELTKGLMKTGKATGSLRTQLTNRASDLAIKDVRYANMAEKELSKTLVKKGYDPAIADEIAAKFANKRGKVVTTPKGKTTAKGKTTPKGKNTTPAKKPRVKKETYQAASGKVTIWQNVKSRLVGMTRAKIFKYLLIAGGLYLVWKWWTDEGSAPFPDCISKNIPKEDFEKMVNEGLDYVLITDTGNSTIDQNGGGRFFDDKKFTTGNGKYSGTWSEKDGGIVITVSGTDYSISCEGMEGSDDTDTDNGSGDGSGTGYKVCDSFPLTKGCKGSKVSEFQKCIGVNADGKFGPKTEQGLKDKGYSTTVTQEVYDKILKNCGQSDSDLEPSIVPDATQSSDI